MLVYGDHARRCAPGELLREVRDRLDAAARAHGLERHAGLVAALIAAGELAQGVADAEFEAAAQDAGSSAQEVLSGLLLELGRAVRASWDARDPGADAAALLSCIDETALPEEIEVRQPEGYAFYALYPEAYAAAAAAVAGGPWRVLGLRSIGTSLAAAVAAALDAPPPITVRPVGHPFERRLEVAPELRARLRSGARIAVVDEGPGLSGSSFGAAVDLLEAEGVPREHIHVFPGHGGDLGREASEAHRARWRALPRHVIPTDALLLASGRLPAWVEDLVGAAAEPIRDLSGGAWRELRFGSEDAWPPVNAAQERRKFLFRTAESAWLVKFAGLGRIGERKLERARALHAAGFSPEPAGLRHGFLVERWIEPAGPHEPPPLDHLRDYLRFRRETFAGGRGAPVEELFEMLRVNVAEELGADAAAAAECFRADLARLQALVRPVETDNRLHAWEWVATADGALLKTDALDHHAAHDLVGAQDPAWDVAGAAVELGLDPDQTARLARAVDAAPELVAFMIAAYCAFQLGWWSMAADAQTGWPAEAGRLAAQRDRYAARLRRMLDA